MRVLAAFDKFKDSMSAPKACDVAAAAVAGARGDWDVECCPLADGGEGFVDILTRAAGGREFSLNVTGPRGAEVLASYGIVPLERISRDTRTRLGIASAAGTVAIVEMAAASGLALLPHGMRDLRHASSAGTGQLIRAAAQSGASAILLGVGGSATHDVGLGALEALGIGFSRASGALLRSVVPADWPLLEGMDGRLPDSIPPILIACDVDNPLLGPRGAAATYGPQKGLKPGDYAEIESQTARIARLLCRHFGRPDSLAEMPGAGAAGGIAFGLMAAAGARLLPGFDLVSSWLQLDAQLAAADIIVTGEGRFDKTSLNGKGPGTVVRRGLALGKAVHVFAGQVDVPASMPGLFTHAITPAGMPLAEALARAPAFLSSAVKKVFAAP